jgi:hypothetical protein
MGPVSKVRCAHGGTDSMAVNPCYIRTLQSVAGRRGRTAFLTSVSPDQPRVGNGLRLRMGAKDCPEGQVTHARHILERGLTQFEIAQ